MNVSKSVAPFLLLIVSSAAYAQDEAEPKNWTLYGRAGFLFPSDVAIELKQNDSILGTANSKQKSSNIFGLEGKFTIPQVPTLAVSGILETMSLKAEAGGANDSITNVLVSGIVQSHTEPMSVWGGLALGLGVLTQGETSATVNGVTGNTEKRATGFTFGVRGGVEFALSDTLVLGPELYWFQSSFNDIPLTLVSGSTSVNLKGSISGSAVGTLLRFGVRL